ncbi:MAG: hypothetical protein IKM40_04935 [Clostridia bacterium]|nr:hypothetical protein [Clostridia bacterium]
MKWRIACVIFCILAVCVSLCGCGENNIRAMEYDSIEELHAAYVDHLSRQEDHGEEWWARELVAYFPYEDKYFVICTYAEGRNAPRVKEGELLVYIVGKKHDKFVLDTGSLGLEICTFSLTEEDPQDNLIGICRINGKKKHVSFVCKGYGDERCYYYDGVRMDEKVFVDPFSNNKLILCYGVSDSVSQLQKLFGGGHKWQLIPDSPTNYIKHDIICGSKCIKVNIEIPMMPTSNEFLIEYTNILADQIEAKEGAEAVLNGGRVDRRQLYAEIKFHMVCWNWGILQDKAGLCEIEIFDGGAVIDSRPWINTVGRLLYGNEYKE